MAILTITTENAGVRFKSNAVDIVYNSFTTKRYTEEDKLDIISSDKENYALFTIKYADYDSITVDGIAATTTEDLQDKLKEIPHRTIITDVNGNDVNITDNALDTAWQDQHTDAVIVPFNKVTNSTTLDTLAVLGAYTISVASATGISQGSFIVLFHPASERFSTFYAVSVVDTTVTLDGPLDFAYPSGTFVDVAITNMNVDGSSTPQVFGLRGTGAPPGVDIDFDLTRMIFECITDTAVDLSKFGDLTALTRGILFRSRNGIYHNIFNVKTNGELAGIMYDWNPYAATNPVQGVDGFVSRLTFAGPSKIGVTVRLPIGEDAEIIIQDDLTDLTSFKIIAEGHIVE
jgi:hypothetical protein